jgi:hypothetical protein
MQHVLPAFSGHGVTIASTAVLRNTRLYAVSLDTCVSVTLRRVCTFRAAAAMDHQAASAIVE